MLCYLYYLTLQSRKSFYILHTHKMFQELQVVLIITMLEVYTRELRMCLSEGGEIEDFPYTDVFKMINKEVGSDTRLLYLLAYSPKVKALLLKITNQVRFGEFEPLCSEKKMALLRSLFRFSKLLSTAA